MRNDFSVEEAIRARHSVRSYDSRVVPQEVRTKILEYAAGIQNPLGPKIRIKLIDKTISPNRERLGTYGIIQGAQLFLCAIVEDVPEAREALGYEFEQLLLYAVSLGLGTCWLGGTFNRGAFATAADVKPGELFPVVSPLGYAAGKQSLTERIMRSGVKADRRLPWEELFYQGDFQTSLEKKTAGEYTLPLEMLRLAPSAVNKQPWRVLCQDGCFHFFEQKSMAGSGQVDLQRLDVGIGICHFHMTALEKGLSGHFEKQREEWSLPDNMVYITSWKAE